MKVLTPVKAIRAKCFDCTCGQSKEIRLCVIKNCPLYPYRMGHRPKAGYDTADSADDEETTRSPMFFEQEVN